MERKTEQMLNEHIEYKNKESILLVQNNRCAFVIILCWTREPFNFQGRLKFRFSFLMSKLSKSRFVVLKSIVWQSFSLYEFCNHN